MTKSDKLAICLTAGAIAAGFLLGGPAWGFVFAIVCVIFLVLYLRHDDESGMSTLVIERSPSSVSLADWENLFKERTTLEDQIVELEQKLRMAVETEQTFARLHPTLSWINHLPGARQDSEIHRNQIAHRKKRIEKIGELMGSGATSFASVSRTIDTKTGEMRTDSQHEVSMSPQFRRQLEEIVSQRNRDTPIDEEWRKLTKGFEALPQGIRATWHQNSDGTDSWKIPHLKCASLCEIAGATLANSPKISSQLSPEILSESDLMFRWLNFLREKGYLSRAQYGEESAAVGEKPNVVLSGCIENIAAVSAAISDKCAALER